MAAPERYLSLPNCITIGRMATLPILVVLMHFDLSLWAFLLFAVAMSSDLLDGYLARRSKHTSTFGKFLDPLADKLLTLTAQIMMIPLEHLPAWIVVIFLVRETMVTTLRGIAVEQGIVIAASRAGKYKSACLSVSTLALLLYYPFWGINWKVIGWIFLLPSLVLSAASGLHYTIGFFREIGRRSRT
ncbi:MAG: CDP-diacylglycerol--glycerol-3-phosphate 3-phosphatidyltransferase [Deltaproteobacteria bacterium]|nr:CDP-diacylglycerol--glycerol-3-phosphate 3-phosphatidyltransferase [Deltaproteobacteria bacterium]